MGNLLTSRVLLRSRSLLEPHARSLDAVRSLRAADPIVAVPTAAQRAFEGAIVAALHWLHAPIPRLMGNRGIEILRIDPYTERLDLHVAPQGVAALLSDNLMPQWYDGHSSLTRGVPGLRYRPVGSHGVEFHRLGRRAAVRFIGFPYRQFLAHRAVARSSGLRSIDRITGMVPQERQSFGPGADLELMSVVIRRFGLLRTVDPLGIDAWWNSPGRYSVELQITKEQAPAYDRLLEMIQSPHLSPRLTLDRAASAGYHAYFKTDHSDLELDLRRLQVTEAEWPLLRHLRRPSVALTTGTFIEQYGDRNDRWNSGGHHPPRR